MDLFSALKLVRDGGMMTRHMWMNPDFHIRLLPNAISEQPVICVKTGEAKPGAMPDGDGFYHHWIISKEDLDATDWEPVAAIPSKTFIVPRPILPDPVKTGGLVAQKTGSPVPTKKKSE